MGGAAVAEEAVGIGIGVEAERLHPGHAGGSETGDDIALEVELEMALAAGREETVILGIGLGEAAREARRRPRRTCGR